MRTKGKRARLLGVVLSFWLLFCSHMLLQSVSVYATELGDEVIDVERKGSITIIKYEDTHSQAEDVNPGIGEEEGESTQIHRPMADVTYTLYRVADIVQGRIEGDENRVWVEYRSLLKNAKGQEIPIPSGITSTKELNQWVNDLRDSADPTMRIANLGELATWQGTTNEQGVLVLGKDEKGENSLPVGIYALYEESYPSLVIETQATVFSMPTTAVDDGNDAASQPDDAVEGDNMAGDSANVGRCWDYELVIRPKNQTKALSVEKHILTDPGENTEADLNYRNADINDPSNDLLTDAEDYAIGDTIRYWVKAQVPENIGEMEFFFLEDRLSMGQIFINDANEGNREARLQVWGEDLSGNMVYIPRVSGTTTNWRVTGPTQAVSEENAGTDSFGNAQALSDGVNTYSTFAIYLNTQSLSAQNVNTDLETTKRGPLYANIYVTYQVELGVDAVIGEPGNPNDIRLKYSHTTTSNSLSIPNRPNIPEEGDRVDTINPQVPDTRVYTYAIEIVKEGEGEDSMEGVEFSLRDMQGNPISLSQDDLGYYVDPEGENRNGIVVIDAASKAQIRGIDAGTYQMIEERAADGYQLLKQPVILTLASESGQEAFPMTYIAEEEGAYFQIEEGKGYYVEQGDTQIVIDLDGFSAGEYVAVPGQTVYSYTRNEAGDLDRDREEVTKRYTCRWTDAETLRWHGNYVMENGLISFTVWNRKSFSIPATGGVGFLPILAVGGTLMLLGIGGYVWSRRGSHAKTK